MIEAIGLTKKYGNFTAVDNLSFRIETGQTLALVGTSGCGKTTTLKMLNRLIEPTQGQVLVEGQDAAKMPVEKLRRQMGYVIQDIGLFPHRTIFDNIATVPRLLGWQPDQIEDRIYTLLERLGLTAESAKKYPDALSGGQQQRVGIARALAADPPIILMDEPFGALDPITRTDIRRDFRHLEELSSKTTIFVTHDIEEAFELADIICVLDKGQVQQIGSGKDLLFRPANAFVRAFLKGKQTELELSAIHLQDLLDDLPTGTTALTATAIAPKATVMACFHQLTAQSKGQQIGQLTTGSDTRFFSLNDLMEAFQSYKARLTQNTPTS